MHFLPNGCYFSEPKVSPKDWKTNRKSISTIWFIYYRYYDPSTMDNIKNRKGKLIILKGMNHFNSHSARVQVTTK